MLRFTITMLVVLSLGTVSSTFAQSHFSGCANLTGNNATVLISSEAPVTLDGDPVPPNSELAVFTQEGLCAGVVVWNGEPTGFTIWGDDVLTTEKDGFSSGEALTYRLWDASVGKEYNGAHVTTVVSLSDAQPFYTTENVYAENAIYELAGLTMETEALSSDDLEMPTVFDLKPNYPNPFNPATTIQYDLPKSGPVRIAIYNAVGAQVDVLVDRTMPPGSHDLRWEAGNLPSGTYFCRVQAGDEIQTQSLILLK